jgi:DNA-binding HxlR family transcriptional regulator
MAADETCPVCRTADIVCGKWTLLLIRDLAEGHTRFCELERSLSGISPRTLSLRLRALEEEGIVARQTYPEVPPRVEYALTEKGRALLPIIEDMREYGTAWLGGQTSSQDGCGRATRADAVLDATGDCAPATEIEPLAVVSA